MLIFEIEKAIEKMQWKILEFLAKLHSNNEKTTYDF